MCGGNIFFAQFPFRIRFNDLASPGLEDRIIVIACFLLLARTDPHQRFSRLVAGYRMKP